MKFQNHFQSQIAASAPSNIALIKYMGKLDHSENLPENPSLSLTLNHLRTEVQWKQTDSSGPFEVEFVDTTANYISRFSNTFKFLPHQWNTKAKDRFSKHIHRCLNEIPETLLLFEVTHFCLPEGRWELQSANTFPEASGIASSASSFAALTLSVLGLLLKNNSEKLNLLTTCNHPFLKNLAGISRKGSGSSCRSLLGPWVEWNHDQVNTVDSGVLGKCTDFVLIISNKEKRVSSSEAHQKIKSSPLWNGRIQRTQSRVQDIKTALKLGNWNVLSKISQDEALEMHSLFHTSAYPFSYWQPGTVEALQILFNAPTDLPIAFTLDAGPNIHILVPTEHANTVRTWLNLNLNQFEILEDTSGEGGSLCLY